MRSSAKARSVPRRASTDMAAVMSAARTRTWRSARASTSIPSMPSVPLMRASPSLARRVTGSMPAAASARGALALADEGQGHVGQGGQVPAGPERAVLVHDGGDAGVEQGDDGVDHHRPHPRVAHGQGPGPQQHHGPHDLGLDQRPHAGGVRADEPPLQLLPPLGRDGRVGQRPEAGGDAVDGLVGGGVGLDDGGAAGQRLAGVVTDRHLGAVAGDAHHLGRGQPGGADDDGSGSTSMPRSSYAPSTPRVPATARPRRCRRRGVHPRRRRGRRPRAPRPGRSASGPGR